MISHNTVECSSYYSIKTLQSYRMIPNHNVALSIFTQVQKFRRRGNGIPAFTKIQEQPLLLPRYRGIGDVPSVLSADKTNDLLHTTPTRSATSAEKQNIWLTRKLNGGEPHLLNIPRNLKARLHGSPRLINAVESTKVNRVNSSFQRKWSTGLTGEQVGDGQLSFNVVDSLWATHHRLPV